MSEGQSQEQQHRSIESDFEKQTLQTSHSADSEGHRLPTRRARVGALLVEVYERPKGGVSPQKVLLQWTKQLVRFLYSSFFNSNISSEKVGQKKNWLSSSAQAIAHFPCLLCVGSSTGQVYKFREQVPLLVQRSSRSF